MSPQTPLPRPKCRWRDTENEAGSTQAKHTAKTAAILIRLAISAQIRRPSPSWACPQDDPPHCPQESSHNHSHPVPASPDQLGHGGFQGGSSESPPARERGQSTRDGSPKGRNRTAGSVHDSPARGTLTRAGAPVVNADRLNLTAVHCGTEERLSWGKNPKSILTRSAIQVESAPSASKSLWTSVGLSGNT